MRRIIFPRGLSRPEGEAAQDAVAVEHGGDAVLDHDGDRFARVRPADGALVPAEFDVAAPIEAASAELPPRLWGEMDALVAQQEEVQCAQPIDSGGVPPCGYYESASARGFSGHTRYRYL